MDANGVYKPTYFMEDKFPGLVNQQYSWGIHPVGF